MADERAVTAVRNIEPREDGWRPECWCGRPAVKYLSGDTFGFPACRRKTHQLPSVAFSVEAASYAPNPHHGHFHVRIAAGGTA